MYERCSGEVLRGVLGTGPSQATLVAQRPRIIATMRRAALADRRRPFILGGLTLAAATLAVVVGAVWAGWAPDFTAVHEGRQLAERSVVRGSRLDGELLRFSDGSEVRVAKEAEARLSRFAPDRVDIALAKGSIHARVSEGLGRSWAVLAGPYRVQVVGTELSVAWSAETGEIDVSVMTGRALVFGFELPPGGLLVEGGSRFTRRGLPPPNPPRPAQEQLSTPLGTGGTPAKILEQAARAAGQAKPSRGARSEAAVAGQDWKALASDQRYSDALAAAREAGFDQMLANLGAVDLLLLANTARYAGDLAEARRTLRELRSRFPGSPSATLGALVLAGIEERAKNPSEAARWLRTFLAESPSSDLSSGARARLLSILVRTGQRSEARRVAADYLRHHPSGPYASQARGVLDSGSDP